MAARPESAQAVSVESSECQKASVDVSTVDKENEAVRQRGSHPEVPNF